MSAQNKKKIAEWEALREKLNKAARQSDYERVIQLCHEIIRLAAEDKSLKIMVFLFYKDIGEAYYKMKDYKNALENLAAAKEGLLEYRRKEKLKFPDAWLHELKVIEKLIQKINAIYFE
jgi:hypothetical protein